ncbi:hypothetical protein ScPMuIL_011946 [Solemya velum]
MVSLGIVNLLTVIVVLPHARNLGQDILQSRDVCGRTNEDVCRSYREVLQKNLDLEQRVRKLELLYGNKEQTTPTFNIREGGVQAKTQPINQQDSRNARDCNDLYEYGYTSSGLYRIQLTDENQILLPCRMDHDWLTYTMISEKRGWAVIQRRDDVTDFDRDWVSYKNGFGDFTGSFWIGFDFLYELVRTNNGSAHFYVRLLFDGEDEQHFTEQFKMDNEDKYFNMLKERGHHSPRARNMSLGTGGEFYTKERKSSRSSSCPNSDGGWWMYGMSLCQYLTKNPNSKFEVDNARSLTGILFDKSVITWTEILLHLERN